MTYRNRSITLAVAFFAGLTVATSGATVFAQTTTNIVRGADGVTYQETRRIVQRSIPVTEYKTHQQKVYQQQTTNQVQSYQQTYLTPITEYRWVVRQRGVLNPFVAPYWTHKLEPFTRWENRAATVQVQVPTAQWVEQQQTVSTPVTTYKTVQEEHVSRVALSVAPAASPVQPATAIASRLQLSPIGGQQLTSDPPRTASGWTAAGSQATTNRYR